MNFFNIKEFIKLLLFLISINEIYSKITRDNNITTIKKVTNNIMNTTFNEIKINLGNFDLILEKSIGSWDYSFYSIKRMKKGIFSIHSPVANIIFESYFEKKENKSFININTNNNAKIRNKIFVKLTYEQIICFKYSEAFFYSFNFTDKTYEENEIKFFEFEKFYLYNSILNGKKDYILNIIKKSIENELKINLIYYPQPKVYLDFLNIVNYLYGIGSVSIYESSNFDEKIEIKKINFEKIEKSDNLDLKFYNVIINLQFCYLKNNKKVYIFNNFVICDNYKLFYDYIIQGYYSKSLTLNHEKSNLDYIGYLFSIVWEKVKDVATL